MFWYCLFAVAYFLIEELFLHLGIYEHHWYKSIYTLLALVPLFRFFKLWYYRVARTSRGWVYYVSLFFSVGAAYSTIIRLPLKLLGLQINTVAIFNDLTRDHTAIGFVIDLFLINILINLYRWKAHWAWKALVFAALFMAIFLLNQIGVIYIKEGWFAAVALLDLFGCYGFIIVMDSFLKQGSAMQSSS